MTNDLLPAKKYPALTDERLSLIADTLRDVRDTTLSLYDPLGGDNQWTHGCRVYGRSCFRVSQLAQNLPWLSIVGEEPKLRFTFAIGGVPIRFYRGTPDDPPGHYIVTTFGELAQRQLFEGLRALDKILRLAIETDADGRVATVKLVELDEAGQATGVYLIPFGVAANKTIPLESKPIHLPAVRLEPREDHKQAKRTNKVKIRKL